MAASKFRIASSSFTSDASFSGSVVFNQDVTVSGTLNVYEMKTTLVSSSIIFKSGSTKFGDTSDDLHQFTGSAEFSSGLSGSLTKLVDGTSYLIAGTNVTIATGSNGAVTISSTGGGGSDVFKTISVAGQSDVVADSATDTLTLAAAGGMTITTDAVSDRITFSSSDTDTTYSAGTGIDLTGTTFSVDPNSLTTDANNGSLDDEIMIADFSDSGNPKKLSLSKVQDLVNTNTTYTAGTGLNLVGTEFSVDSDGATLTTSNADVDHILINDGGVFKRITPGNINISSLNNDSGFTANTGDITGVTAGTGLSGGGSTGTVTLNVDLSELTDMTQAVNSSEDELIILDNGNDRRKLISEIPLSAFNNDSGFTANTGDITSVTAGTGLSGGGISGAVTLNLDFSELTDMTGDISGTTEFILQDGTTESRKAASEIKLSAFNNDAGYSTVSSLDDLSDVDLTVAASDTSILIYDSTASAFERQILSGDVSMTREGVVTVISASSAGKIDTTATNPTATYYIPFVENATATEGDIMHVNSSLSVNQSGQLTAHTLNSSYNVNVGASLAHNGDSDTRIYFTTDRIQIQAGGVEFFDLVEGTTYDVARFNNAGADIDFFMETTNLQSAFLLDSGNDQLLLMCNVDDPVKERDGDGIPGDVNLFISGSVGSKDSSVKGTTLFNGDVVISGSLYTYGSNRHVHALIALGNDETNMATNSDYAPRLDRALINQGAGWNTGTYTFTAPYDGLYAVNANVALHQLDSAAGGYKIFLSGSDTSTMIPKQVILDSVSDNYFNSDTAGIGSGAAPFILNGSAHIKMAAGDFFLLYVYQVGGTQQTDILGNSASDISNNILNGTHISVVKMS